MEVARSQAYNRLAVLAAKYRSRGLASIAVEAKSAGHFDKVIAMIDDMMAVLRKEEQDDIAHRDRCENGQNANKNSMEDLNNDITKAKKKKQRMQNTDDGLKKD